MSTIYFSGWINLIFSHSSITHILHILLRFLLFYVEKLCFIHSLLTQECSNNNAAFNLQYSSKADVYKSRFSKISNVIKQILSFWIKENRANSVELGQLNKATFNVEILYVFVSWSDKISGFIFLYWPYFSDKIPVLLLTEMHVLHIYVRLRWSVSESKAYAGARALTVSLWRWPWPTTRRTAGNKNCHKLDLLAIKPPLLQSVNLTSW